MSNSKICILDHTSLGDLHNAFEYAGDSVLKVQKAIADYLRGVIEVMEQQFEYVQKKFEEAEKRLEAAKSRLAAAEAQLAAQRDSLSSSMDGYGDSFFESVGAVASGAYHSAASAACAGMVAAARADCARAQLVYDKWKKNYETAEKVLSQCKGYRSDWDYWDPLNSGGDHHLERLGKDRTDEATKKLRKILEVVERYLNVSISSDGKRVREEVVALDEYDKKKIIGDSGYEVRNEQIRELNRHHAMGANRVAKCKKCGRPLSICVCGYTRKNIDII